MPGDPGEPARDSRLPRQRVLADNRAVAATFPSRATALGLAALVVVFFPVLFFGRVISPMDVIQNRPPWDACHHPVEVSNAQLVDPATAYLPLMKTARRDGTATAVFNPYLSCGTVGTLAWNAGLLTPAVAPFLPWLDPARFASAMVLVKLLLALVGTWLLLRRLGLGETAAAVGAVASALAAPLSALWLWPSSATWAALPLLLWALDRTARSARPWRTAAVTAGAMFVFLAGGSATATVLGLALATVWTVARVPGGGRTGAAGRLAAIVASGLVALAVLTPSLGLFMTGARATGALEATPHRVGLGLIAVRLLVDPFALGDPRRETFSPPAGLQDVGYAELALTVGWITAALALLGLASRRRGTGFWAAAGGAAFLVLAWTPAARVLGLVPGLAHVPPWRTAPVVALAAAVLAGHGVAALEELGLPVWTRRMLPWLGLAIILQQGLLAGHLLTWLRPKEAIPPWTPGLRFLAEKTAGTTARVAPLGDVLWPDTAQWFGLEDVRSRFASTRAYRRLLGAIDPQVWDHHDRNLRLNPATIELTHPYLGALGARWVLEDPRYELVDLSLAQETLEIEPRGALLGPLRARTRDPVIQELQLPPHCSRIALNATSQGQRAEGDLRIRLESADGRTLLADWTVAAPRLAREGSAWLDLPARLDTGTVHRLVVEPRITSGRIWLRRTSNPSSLRGTLTWGRRTIRGDLGLSLDVSGYVKAWEGRDLRIWENRRALERFWTVDRAVTGDLDTLLQADPPLDLASVAVVPPGHEALAARLQEPGGTGEPATVSIRRKTPGSWSVRVQSSRPVLLVSSLPAVPPLWRVVIDGSPVEWLTVDAVFMGVPVPQGDHRVEVTAGLPLWWRVACGLGLASMLGFVGLAIPRRREAAA